MGMKIMEARISIITLGVSDLPQSIRFYRDGLGFPTNANESDEIAFFTTAGTRLALYPLEKLAEDIGPGVKPARGFSGITLALNVRRKKEVAEVLAFARKAGGKIVKPAQDVFWGGHSGYFSDPDGYYWEVVWAPKATFDQHGHICMEAGA
jgi:catechol 2,3-dioxygenase-like lactoylglutathione lyase family enzyme